MTAVDGERAEVCRALRAGEKFCLVTHERPDGDALGSLLGAYHLLLAMGKDVVMVVHAADLPLPHEYDFLDISQALTEMPPDLAERTVVYLDCGNADRNPVTIDGLAHGPVLNIDHHHDNTRFGDVDYVDGAAACTAEMLWLIADDLGVTIDRAIGVPLYVGLVTDTGKFMYENSSARSHRMAAELIESGVETHPIYRRLYEDVPVAKLELLGRALALLERHDDGALAIVSLQREDFESVGAADSDSEGIIDHLRAIEGTKVAAFARSRERPNGNGRVTRKVSLRSADGEVDVSAIARAGGGGGHRQAAGFSTELDDAELLAFLRAEIAAQRA
ncbi:MAG: DHH family phosphoesterase [Baekduia sp.]